MSGYMTYIWEESPDEAYKEGYKAYQRGLKTEDNPYNNNEEWELHEAWLEGYRDAQFDD